MKTPCNYYWFYLEPSVFIFENTNEVLLYDSESKNKIIVHRTKNIDSIIRELLDVNNMYCIPVNSELSANDEVPSFIRLIKGKFMGDMVSSDFHKPVVIPPIMKCHADKTREETMFLEGTSVMTLLNEITFYLNGKCSQNCRFCSSYYQQSGCCYRGEGELNVNEVIKLTNRVLATSSSIKINYNGGNLFLYSKIDILLQHVIKRKLKVNLHFHYLNWRKEYAERILNDYFYLHIYITSIPLEEKMLSIADLTKQKENRIKVIFIVQNEEELDDAQFITDKYALPNYTILPFYSGENTDFFRQIVYMNAEELWNASPTKTDIYKRQKVNINDVGKLKLSCKGEYFSNMNFSSLGDISEDIVQIVGKEWNSGIVWKRTRTMKPCINCIYQYLCPSPSNYEITMGRNNLCHIVTE